MARCDLTGKGTATGNNRSHSNRATRRTFKANIQNKKVSLGGTSFKAKLCSTVIKTLGKDEKGIKKLLEKLNIPIS